MAKGELQLSVLSVLTSYLNAGNAAELFNACSGKSFEQVEVLLAARFPRPDVRDLIRRLPDADRRTPDIGTRSMEARLEPAAEAEQGGTLRDLGTAPTPAAPPEIPMQTPPPAPARARIEPLSPDRFGVHFTADAEFRDLLAEVRALASHQQPKGELLLLMKRALEAYRRGLRKKLFAVGDRPRSDAGSRAPASLKLKRTRHVSAPVRRAVYERDEGKCTFVSDDGRRCGTQQFLEIDHVQPWALSGESTVDNLRLRCRAHNQHSARAHFGGTHVREAIERARGKRRKSERPETTRNQSDCDDRAGAQTLRGGGGSADLSIGRG